MKSRLLRNSSILLMFLYLFSPILLTRANENEPAKKVVLNLSWLDDQGKIVGKGFSLSDIENLPQTSITLELPESVGITGEHVWQGTPLSSLVALSGRKTDSLKIAALNGYSVSVPANDIDRYNPTLVYRRDGMLISVREKGPFLLIYPFNKFPELNQQIYLNRLVWQINEITLQ
ncbi:hypothetical protein [Pseudomonas jessenii]|uniref:hypothetical protein n=1 Tax=Pseudomonas jessenii TaxID=77298 RepID=UPI003891F0B6